MKQEMYDNENSKENLWELWNRPTHAARPPMEGLVFLSPCMVVLPAPDVDMSRAAPRGVARGSGSARPPQAIPGALSNTAAAHSSLLTSRPAVSAPNWRRWPSRRPAGRTRWQNNRPNSAPAARDGRWAAALPRSAVSHTPAIFAACQSPPRPLRPGRRVTSRDMS